MNDCFTGFAILVDDPVGTPGEVVAQGVGGELGQGADAQMKIVQAIKAFRQVVSNN